MSDEIPMRQVSGGWVREDAYPGEGMPTEAFPGELGELRETEALMRQVAQLVLTPEARRARGHDCWADIPAEVARLKFELGSLKGRIDTALEFARVRLLNVEESQLRAVLVPSDASFTRSTPPPSLADATDGPGEGLKPEGVPAPAQAVLVPPYSPHPEPCAADCGHPEHPAEAKPSRVIVPQWAGSEDFRGEDFPSEPPGTHSADDCDDVTCRAHYGRRG
jgi:hypothetical protein